MDKVSSPKLWFKNLKHLMISTSNSKNWKHVWEFWGFLFYTFIHCPFTKNQCLSSQDALDFFWLVSLAMPKLVSWKLRSWLMLASSLFLKKLVILGLFFVLIWYLWVRLFIIFNFFVKLWIRLISFFQSKLLIM